MVTHRATGRGGTTEKIAHALVAAAAFASAIWIVAVVSAHQDRQTLVAANLTKAYGVGAYRVTQRHGGFWPEPGEHPAETEIRAHILSSDNRPLGKFRMELYWKQVWEPNLKPPQNKDLLIGEDYELEWGGETLKVEMKTDQRTTAVWYNGRQVLGASLDKNKKPQMRPGDEPHLLEQRKELFEIINAIETDLRQAFPPPPKPITCCGPTGSGEVVCSGNYVWGDGSAINKQSAILNAQAAANLNCWNQYCTGCCELGGVDCWCIGDVFPGLGGLLCSCQTWGRTCRCQQGYI
jgi:hypothetical protein